MDSCFKFFLLIFLMWMQVEDSLGNNQHLDFLPKVHCNYLQAAKTANCSFKNLTEVPKDLNPEIQILLLNNNLLNHLGPDTFRRYPKLLHINLSGNQLRLLPSVYHPKAFAGLMSLKELNLELNCDSFTNPSSKYSYPGDSLSPLASLERLSIDAIPDVQLGTGFKNLTNLVSLNFTGYCYLNSVRKDMFENTPQLQYLDIARCFIYDIDSTAFSPLKSIRIINASENYGLGFRNASKCTEGLVGTSIQVLQLDRIVLPFTVNVRIFKDFFLHLHKTNITEIHLNHNAIETLEDNTLKYYPSTLEVIHINDNRLTSGQYMYDAMKMTGLKEIYVSDMAVFHHFVHSQKRAFGGRRRERGKLSASRRERTDIERLKRPKRDLSGTRREKRDPEGLRRASRDLAGSSRDISGIRRESRDLAELKRLGRDVTESRIDFAGLRRSRRRLAGVRRGKGDLARPKRGMTNDGPKRKTRSLAISKRGNLNSIAGIFPGITESYVWQGPSNLEVVVAKNFLMNGNIPRLNLNLSSIRTIDISNNVLVEWKGPVYHFKSLQNATLKRCFCSKIDQKFFVSFPNLLFLDISYNLIGDQLNNDMDGDLFSPLTTLMTLNTSANKISTLHQDIFLKNIELKTLDLSNNELSKITFKLTQLTRLENLLIRKNQIRSIPTDIRHELDAISKTHKLSIDLTDNPLQCTCEDVLFMNWLTHTKINFLNKKSYTCINVNNAKVNLTKELIMSLDTKCRSVFGVLFGGTIAVALVTCVTVIGIVYRYRWKIKYLYYVARDRYRPIIDHGLEQRYFQYDAFVSFADEDLDFVKKLVERLEGQGRRLCIHNRDFRPGEPIAANIVRAVQRSRRTIIVLSRNFLSSQWCKYEFEMAKMESVHEERKVILVVKIQDLEAKEIPRELMYMMRTDSYSEFPWSPEDQQIFWTTLNSSIAD